LFKGETLLLLLEKGDGEGFEKVVSKSKIDEPQFD